MHGYVLISGQRLINGPARLWTRSQSSSLWLALLHTNKPVRLWPHSRSPSSVVSRPHINLLTPLRSLRYGSLWLASAQ